MKYIYLDISINCLYKYKNHILVENNFTTIINLLTKYKYDLQLQWLKQRVFDQHIELIRWLDLTRCTIETKEFCYNVLLHKAEKFCPGEQEEDLIKCAGTAAKVKCLYFFYFVIIFISKHCHIVFNVHKPFERKKIYSINMSKRISFQYNNGQVQKKFLAQEMKLFLKQIISLFQFKKF